MVVVFPLPAGPLRSNNLLRDLPLKTSVSHVCTSATFLLCTASSSSESGPYFSVHGRLSPVSCRAGWDDDDDDGGVLRDPPAVRKNFCLLLTALGWSVGAVAAIGLLRTGSEFEGLMGRASSEESRMSSTSSMDMAGFSGLGVGCVACERGTLVKKEVMGLDIGLSFPGDLAGDFLVAAAFAGCGDAARVWDRVGFFSRRGAVDVLASVPLLGRSGGGVCEASSSESDESTTGFFRAVRSLAIPARGDQSEGESTAQ